MTQWRRTVWTLHRLCRTDMVLSMWRREFSQTVETLGPFLHTYFVCSFQKCLALMMQFEARFCAAGSSLVAHLTYAVYDTNTHTCTFSLPRRQYRFGTPWSTVPSETPPLSCACQQKQKPLCQAAVPSPPPFLASSGPRGSRSLLIVC